MKSIVTEHSEICFICGRQTEAEHHLVFGTAGRELSEKDGLKVPVCNNCHNMGGYMGTRWLRRCRKSSDSLPGSGSGY